MSIQVLPQDVINQIAAGEVVERPTHLVKELVENALDAGSTEIEIAIDQGGRCVRVRDNGQGIAPDDFAHLFHRHATSKIETALDLWDLHSYGFRGEALASIGAVSHLTLTSRAAGHDHARRVHCQFGKISAVETLVASAGTSIEVRELFGNIPARLKFLKSDAAELTQIKTMIKALAIKNPHVQWKLDANGKSVFFWFKETPLSRVQRVLEVETLFEGVHLDGEIRVQVYVSPPQTTVATQRGMWFFAQSRFVQDRTVQAAVMDAYRGLLMHGEYPMAVVMIEVPPEDIDVNIHPAKSQVKFLEGSRIFKSVQRAIRGVLEKAPWVPLITANARPPSERPPLAATDTFQDAAIHRTQYWQKPAPPLPGPVTTPLPAPPLVARAVDELDQALGLGSGPPMPAARLKGHWASVQILGQLRLTYIVAQTEAKLLLVDQHAAHERVMFEKLMAAWNNGARDVQKYLIPLTLDLDAGMVEALLKHQSPLAHFGIEIEALSPSCLSIAGGPALLSETALVKGLEKLGKEVFEHGESFAMERTLGDVCATMACHSAVRAGQALSFEQMHELLRTMDEFPLSSFCPHGRPVWIEWSFGQIETAFGRS